MLIWKTRLLTISSLFLLLFCKNLPLQAQAVVEKEPTATTSSIYQRAKEQLPSDLYALYRIIDRIARANSFDNHHWQVSIVQKYDTNAFATQENLITVYNRILNQLVGDSSALACIVGREMGHHLKHHTAVSESQKVELITKIREQAQQEVLGDKKVATTKKTVANIGGAIAEHVLPGFLSDLINGVLEKQTLNRIQQAEKRIDEIVTQKTQELEQRLSEQSQEQQLESDQMGYITSVRAGFEPEGCLRAMAILAKTSAQTDTTDTVMLKRIEALKAFIEKNPAQTFTQEGEEKISATQPLSYELSRNGEFLKVHSRHGASVADDIDTKFGN